MIMSDTTSSSRSVQQEPLRSRVRGLDPAHLIDSALRLGMLPVLMLAALVPQASLQSLLPACLFDSLLELECWGCGLTRALILMLQGRFGEALAVNALALPVLILLASLFFQHIHTILKGRHAHA